MLPVVQVEDSSIACVDAAAVRPCGVPLQQDALQRHRCGIIVPAHGVDAAAESSLGVSQDGVVFKDDCALAVVDQAAVSGAGEACVGHFLPIGVFTGSAPIQRKSLKGELCVLVFHLEQALAVVAAGENRLCIAVRRSDDPLSVLHRRENASGLRRKGWSEVVNAAGLCRCGEDDVISRLIQRHLIPVGNGVVHQHLDSHRVVPVHGQRGLVRPGIGYCVSQGVEGLLHIIIHDLTDRPVVGHFDVEGNLCEVHGIELLEKAGNGSLRHAVHIGVNHNCPARRPPSVYDAQPHLIVANHLNAPCLVQGTVQLDRSGCAGEAQDDRGVCVRRPGGVYPDLLHLDGFRPLRRQRHVLCHADAIALTVRNGVALPPLEHIACPGRPGLHGVEGVFQQAQLLLPVLKAIGIGELDKLGAVGKADLLLLNLPLCAEAIGGGLCRFEGRLAKQGGLCHNLVVGIRGGHLVLQIGGRIPHGNHHAVLQIIGVKDSGREVLQRSVYNAHRFPVAVQGVGGGIVSHHVLPGRGVFELGDERLDPEGVVIGLLRREDMAHKNGLTGQRRAVFGVHHGLKFTVIVPVCPEGCAGCLCLDAVQIAEVRDGHGAGGVVVLTCAQHKVDLLPAGAENVPCVEAVVLNRLAQQLDGQLAHAVFMVNAVKVEAVGQLVLVVVVNRSVVDIASGYAAVGQRENLIMLSVGKTSVRSVGLTVQTIHDEGSHAAQRLVEQGEQEAVAHAALGDHLALGICGRRGVRTQLQELLLMGVTIACAEVAVVQTIGALLILMGYLLIRLEGKGHAVLLDHLHGAGNLEAAGEVEAELRGDSAVGVDTVSLLQLHSDGITVLAHIHAALTGHLLGDMEQSGEGNVVLNRSRLCCGDGGSVQLALLCHTVDLMSFRTLLHDVVSERPFRGVGGIQPVHAGIHLCYLEVICAGLAEADSPRLGNLPRQGAALCLFVVPFVTDSEGVLGGSHHCTVFRVLGVSHHVELEFQTLQLILLSVSKLGEGFIQRQRLGQGHTHALADICLREGDGHIPIHRQDAGVQHAALFHAAGNGNASGQLLGGHQNHVLHVGGVRVGVGLSEGDHRAAGDILIDDGVGLLCIPFHAVELEGGRCQTCGSVLVGAAAAHGGIRMLDNGNRSQLPVVRDGKGANAVGIRL